MAIVAANIWFAPTVDARPEYNTQFWDKYPSLKDLKEETKCSACHDPKDKKIRNDYGKAVGTALGEPKIKDAEKIKAALTKAEGEKSSTAGKTFGDLIKDGKLPGKLP
jgi:cytochrome c553